MGRSKTGNQDNQLPSLGSYGELVSKESARM